jgi:hypothetical protein
VALLTSWHEAFDFSLAHGSDVEKAITYADGFFDCPSCGEADCGATCTGMLDVLQAAIREGEDEQLFAAEDGRFA